MKSSILQFIFMILIEIQGLRAQLFITLLMEQCTIIIMKLEMGIITSRFTIGKFVVILGVV